MGTIVRLPENHARTSQESGHKSGRSSERETPVSRSIGKTNSAGTPFFERFSQYQINDCLVPMSSASRSWLPARSQATLSASTDMGASYPILGKTQPKNMWGTDNPKFGSHPGMDVDPITFGRRVRARRKELTWSQEKLADESGFSQTNIGWIEQGKAKDPTKQAIRLSKALGVNPDWLLYEAGPKETGPIVMTREQLRKAYDQLPAEGQLEVRVIITDVVAKYRSKKKRA